jgi:hypothetical protein
MFVSKLSSHHNAFARRLMLAAAVAGAFMGSGPLAFGRSEGPFANFAGNWRGSGRVVTTDGKSERLTCRATYSVAAGAESLSQSLVCASDSYRVDIRSNIVSNGHDIQGSWQEATHNANGGIVGTMDDRLLEGVVSCPGFSARISVKTTGRKQIVIIHPESTDVASVDITMVR